MRLIIKDHPHCCGGKDVEGMNCPVWTPSQFIKALVQKDQKFHSPPTPGIDYIGRGFYNIVGAGSTNISIERMHNRMSRLGEYIEKYKLGTLTVAPQAPNTNYKGLHKLLPAIFTPDNPALYQFAVKRKWIENKLVKDLQKPLWHFEIGV